MKFFRPSQPPKSSISRAEALACTPVISQAVRWEKRDSGGVLIEYPIVVKPLLKAIFKRFNAGGEHETMSKKLELDAMGSEVWCSIDGEKTVRDIIREFASSSSVTSQEAELAVTTFLRELGKRGLIVLR